MSATLASGSRLRHSTAASLLISPFFLGPFHLQGPGGHGPLATGLLFLPVAVGTVLGAHLAGGAIGDPVGSSIAGSSIAAGHLAAPDGLTDALAFTAVSAAVAAVAALFLVPAGRPPAGAATAHVH